MEGISAISWLARERKQLGGWLLRANDGVTRRANSVLPLDSPSLEINEAIAVSVDFYQHRKLIPRFQMTPISQPEGLDDILADTGWEYGLEVAIGVAENKDVLRNPVNIETGLMFRPDEEWMKAYIAGSGHTDADPQIREQLMLRSPMKKVFAMAKIDSTIASVGIGVRYKEWVGLFNIATIPRFRNQKAGTAVSQVIVAWGKSLGATHSYLQVETRNEPAKKLYDGLGFSNYYTYWYRVFRNEK
jgi:GNAT superfamily N-acetyltransferase